MSLDKRVDNYIEKMQPFAKPILIHLRKLIHETCADVEETIKWGMPFFMYKGILCHFAAFKNHAVFGFWKGSLMSDPVLIQNAKTETAMGHLGKLTTLKDLPSDKKIKAYIKEAMKLNEDGIDVVKAKPITSKELIVPDEILKAIKKNTDAFATFKAFSASNKKEYLEWITEAKTETTKDKRLTQAIEWMAEGKPRNWKYMKKY